MSAGHVDAVARLAGELDDAGRAELKDLQAAVVRSAVVMPVETFEREMSKLGRALSCDDGMSRMARLRQQRCVRRWVDRVAGMCHTHLQVDPETDARIASVLDAAVASARAAAQGDDVEFDHLKADALVGLITGARTTGPRIPDLTLLTDSRTMRDGPHERTVCETGDGNRYRSRRCAGWAVTPPSPRSPSTTTQSPSRWGGPGGWPPRAAPGAAGDVSVLWVPGLSGAVRGLPDPSRHLVGTAPHTTWNCLRLGERDHHHVHEAAGPSPSSPTAITLRRPDGSLHHEVRHRTAPSNPERRPPSPWPRIGTAAARMHLGQRRHRARRNRASQSQAERRTPAAANGAARRSRRHRSPEHASRAAWTAPAAGRRRSYRDHPRTRRRAPARRCWCRPGASRRGCGVVGDHRHRPDGEVRQYGEQPSKDREPLAEPDVAALRRTRCVIRRVEPLRKPPGRDGCTRRSPQRQGQRSSSPRLLTRTAPTQRPWRARYDHAEPPGVGDARRGTDP